MDQSKISISTDQSKLKIEAIKKLFKQTYWASKRTEKTIQKSLEHSICYGVFYGDELVGFGRVVTDYATVFWVCDIIIDEAYRGNRLGKKLMETILESEELKGIPGILATKDAHGLYEPYGFVLETEKFMRKKRTSNR